MIEAEERIDLARFVGQFIGKSKVRNDMALSEVAKGIFVGKGLLTTTRGGTRKSAASNLYSSPAWTGQSRTLRGVDKMG